MTNLWLEQSDKVIALLEILLASENIHNLKIRKYHWNIENMKFKELHLHFEDLYNQSFERSDEIAERIRTLDAFAIGTYSEYLQKSFLEEDEEMTNDAQTMITRLLEDKEMVIREVRTFIKKCEEYNDVGTADFLTGILTTYEKDAWMLRSMKH